jgi:SPP1 family predicted phage head-tail adaptor
LRAGKLRHRITIQTQPSTAQNEYGALSTTGVWYDDTKNIFAGIWPLRGDEYHLANQGQSNVTHRIQMRWMPLADGSMITSRCRIKFSDPELKVDRYFEIVGVTNIDEKNRTLQFMAKEQI